MQILSEIGRIHLFESTIIKIIKDIIMNSRELSPAVFFAPSVSHRTPLRDSNLIERARETQAHTKITTKAMKMSH